MTKKGFKITMLILIAIVILGFAFLVWGNQTGRISIWANPVPVSILTVDSVCSRSDNKQIDKLTYVKGATNYDLYSFKVYAGTSYANTDNGWVNISPTDQTCNQIYGGTCPNCYRQTSTYCSFGPHDPHGWNYRVIGHVTSTGKNTLLGEKRATQCTISTPTTTAPTTTTSVPTTTTPTTTATTAIPTPTPSPSPTINKPNPPTNLKSSEVTSDSVKLSWDAVTTATSYGIYNADEVSWIATADSNSYTISGLKCETDYSFHVTAINEQGYGSNPSDTVTVTTGQCKNIVTDISTKKPENTQIEYDGQNVTISWNKVDDASGYDIYNCSGTYITSTDQTSYTLDQTSDIQSSEDCNVTACYYVIAHDSAGVESKASDQMETMVSACTTPVIDNSNSDTPITKVTKLVSTGASLWFNILLALLLIGGIGYFMFRKEINGK